jgi:hypothetical protein
LSYEDIPVDVGVVYEGERVRGKDMFVELDVFQKRESLLKTPARLPRFLLKEPEISGLDYV